MRLGLAAVRSRGLWIAIAAAASIISIGSPSALGESSRAASGLLQKYAKANADCRGYPGGSEKSDKACKRRDKIADKLTSLGWCYGNPGEVGYQMVWHRCNSASRPPPSEEKAMPPSRLSSAKPCPDFRIFVKSLPEKDEFDTIDAYSSKSQSEIKKILNIESASRFSCYLPTKMNYDPEKQVFKYFAIGSLTNEITKENLPPYEATNAYGAKAMVQKTKTTATGLKFSTEYSHFDVELFAPTERARKIAGLLGLAVTGELKYPFAWHETQRIGATITLPYETETENFGVVIDPRTIDVINTETKEILVSHKVLTCNEYGAIRLRIDMCH